MEKEKRVKMCNKVSGAEQEGLDRHSYNNAISRNSIEGETER